MAVKEDIIAILKEIKPTKNLADVNNIVEGGYIDSFELMFLITSISEKFNISIEVDDITPENFNSVDGITKMVTDHLK